MEQMTREQAVAFGESRAWERMTPRARAALQLEQRLLCMPFTVFHDSLEAALGRSVWTHEIAMNNDGLAAELGGGDGPTFDEILALIPAGKLVVVVT